jgi:hypothetical protein
MASAGVAVHRTIIAVDVEGFGDRRRTNRNQVAVRDGLYGAMSEAFGQADVSWADCHREDRGDGIFILAGAEVPKSKFAEIVPSALAAALCRHNGAHPDLERIRVRMVLHAGEVIFDQHGVAAASVNLAFRLLECGPVKAELAASPGVLAVIASSWFFDEVIRHSRAATAEYHAVPVAVKETTTTGWICLPDHPGRLRPGMPGSRRDHGPASTAGLRRGQVTHGLRHAVHAGDPPPRPEETHFRMPRSSSPVGDPGISPSWLEASRGIRRGADRLLETQAVSPATVDHWEMAVDRYENRRMTAWPAALLTQLLSDSADLQQILSRPLPLDSRRRLYYVMARFAGMTGLTWVDHANEKKETKRWFKTAKLFAEEADDRNLSAWVTVCKSASYLWYGRKADRGVQYARSAQLLAGRSATGIRAWAYLLEARGQALLGHRREALIAIRSAEDVYEHPPSGETSASGFALHPHLMRFCQENALLFASENKEAFAQQDQAFGIPSAVPAHQVLVALDRASCLIRSGDLGEGCRTANRSLATLPSGPWPGIVLFRAKQVAAAATRNKIELEPVRELRETLRAAEASSSASKTRHSNQI